MVSLPSSATVAQGEPGLQHGFELKGPSAVGMVVSKVLAAPEQVRQTRLVQRVVEAPIGRPPVADEHGVEVGLQDGERVVETAARADGVDGGVRGGKHPEPVALAADAPAGLVRGDDGCVADLLAQRRVGRLGVAGRAMQHVHQAARGDGQPEPGPEQLGDLRQRDTQVRVQLHDQRDDLRTELHAGGSQCIGGLQRVAALHPPPTLRAVADVDVEAAHEGTHHREVFLVLRRHPVTLTAPPQSGHAAGADAE